MQCKFGIRKSGGLSNLFVPWQYKTKDEKSPCTVGYLGVCFAKRYSEFRSFLGSERLVSAMKVYEGGSHLVIAREYLSGITNNFLL